MLAIDTNLIVRFFVGDHPGQSAKARALVGGRDVFVCTTVLMETEWVLRSIYKFGPAQISAALAGFAGLPGVTLEHPAITATAIEWMNKGIDFADALHLLLSGDCEAFVTFDSRFAKSANRLGGVAIRVP